MLFAAPSFGGTGVAHAFQAADSYTPGLPYSDWLMATAAAGRGWSGEMLAPPCASTRCPWPTLPSSCFLGTAGMFDCGRRLGRVSRLRFVTPKSDWSNSFLASRIRCRLAASFAVEDFGTADGRRPHPWNLPVNCCPEFWRLIGSGWSCSSMAK